MPAEITLDDYHNWLRTQLPKIVAPDTFLVSIESGWDTRVLEVDGQWIFRFARRPEIADQFRKELHLLPGLADHLPFAIPNPEFSCLDDPDYTCMGYRKLNGEALSDVTATPAMAAQIASFLNCLHQFPLEALPQIGLLLVGSDDWQTAYLDFYRWVHMNVLPKVSKSLGKVTCNLWEGFLGTEENFQFKLVPIHGDLGVEHILIDPGRDCLVGVIDWGDAQVGDPALDFTGLLASCGAEFVGQVLESYTGPPDGRLSGHHPFSPDALWLGNWRRTLVRRRYKGF
jgi:aminoglycoside 2''-phosphotransferase